MSSEMTPREHDDMRDLVLAGAQRIRPAVSYRRIVSVGLAVAVVVVVAGGVATALNGRGGLDGPVVAPTTASPTPSATRIPTTSPAPTPTMPPEWCEPSDFPQASLPGATPPLPGEHLILELDPCLTVKTLLGSYSWLEDKGIDADLIQGFQSVDGDEAWTAPLADGSGGCILLRAGDRNGWGTISCDAPGAPAALERTHGSVDLRFVVENGAVVVYATSP